MIRSKSKGCAICHLGRYTNTYDRPLAVLALAVLVGIPACHRQTEGPATGVKKSPLENLPRLLLLGDSISLGYDQPARDLLTGKATVHHPPENCQSTEYGLQQIEQWLGDERWDVIHFNWGLWDAHHLEDDRLRTTPEQYEQNLRALVSRLKTTGARLIWASTTPTKTIHQGGIWVEGSDIPIRNDIARRVMVENNIPINDLYGQMLPNVRRLRGDDGCHYTPEGYAFLAQCRR